MARAVVSLTADADGIRRAAAVIRAGGLVAFPTETVYGLGADGTNAAAVAEIFAVKGRPADNPLILHVADAQAAQRLAREWPPSAEKLAAAFWPGPLTLVLPARPEVLEAVRGGLDTVAVRSPSHPVARELVRQSGVPIAAPSANRSGRPSPTTAQAVREELAGAEGPVVWLLEGGPVAIGVESTVVDVSSARLLLLRPGGLPREAMEQLVGPIGDPPAHGPARSPGMRYRHYAPTRPLVLLVMSDPDAVEALAAWPPAATGLLAPHAVVAQAPGFTAVDLGDTAAEAAHRLFSGLRTLDRAPGLEQLVAVWNNQQGIGLAVMNRLERAAEEVRRA